MRDSLKNKIKKNKWFVATVVIPVTCVAIYQGLIASDVYVSESRFVIKAPNQRQGQISTLANLFQTTGLSAGQEQANEIIDYVTSRSGLSDLDKQGDVASLFSRPGADLLSRYPLPWKPRARETLFHYYSDMVTAAMDHSSGLVVLKAKAFTPEDAQAINSRLLKLSENLVNQLNVRARAKEISEAESRVIEAEGRVRRARLALADFRNRKSLLDPGKQASGVLEISNRLVSEQAALQAQLEQMLQVAPANPAIPGIRKHIEAISREIAAQNGRAMGTRSGIASQLSGYENLQLEQEFAAQNLLAASAALEQARSESVRQQFYLERVVEPDRPDLAEFPHRWRIVLTTLAASLVLYFIGWMFVVGILEHAPED